MTPPPPRRAARHEPPDPVATIEWPTHQQRRSAIARSGRAALLVVARGHAPPEDLGPLEDWIRAPLDPVELTVRTGELRLRHGLRRGGVHVDDHGVLHHDGRRVKVTRAQQALLAPLLVRIGQPVARDEVRRASSLAGGPEHPDDVRRALARLRTRLQDVGLGLHLLSGRAVLLDPSAPRDSSHRADQTGNLHETSTHDPDARSTRLI
jgi:hypothetical protein